MKSVWTNSIFPPQQTQKLHLKMYLHTVWWSWAAINAFTYTMICNHTNIQCYNEIYNGTFKYESKPPVGGARWVSHWFNRFVQTADSFRNEASDYCLYEWVTESLTHSIRSKTWINSVTKQCCVVQRHKTVLLWLWLDRFSSAKLSKTTQYYVLFIELLLYKISVTLQSFWYSGKHLVRVG